MYKPTRLRHIVESVCQTFGVDETDLRGNGGSREVSAAREAYAYLARSMTSHSWPEIMRGLKPQTQSHSSVYQANRRAIERLETDAEFDRRIQQSRRETIRHRFN